MEFQVGDVLTHEKTRELLFYFITDVCRDGMGNYRYTAYDDELFENFSHSGRRKAELMEKRVEMSDADMDEALQGYDVEHRSNWEYVGNVSEVEPAIEIEKNAPYHTIHLERMKLILFEVGWHGVKDAQLYYETAGTERTFCVHRVGHSRDDLADDMATLSVVDEYQQMVEHKGRILEAIQRGIWIPIKPIDSKIDGKKVSRI